MGKVPGGKEQNNLMLESANETAMVLSTITNRDVAQDVTREALSTLNQGSMQALGIPFSQAVVQYCPEEKIVKNQTDTERKRHQRKVMRKCTKHLESQIGDRDAVNVLAENQSLSSYKQMRISQSFETPEAKRERYAIRPPKTKKHSPKFDRVTWDKERLHHTLVNWPENETINWSQVARDHGISAKNGGQIPNEFAKERGIDTEPLDNRKGGVKMCAKKLRMPGGEISVPCHKTVDAVKEDWARMIESGELTLCEPCAPYTIKKYAIINGEIKRSEFEVYGCKVSLLHIRKQL